MEQGHRKGTGRLLGTQPRPVTERGITRTALGHGHSPWQSTQRPKQLKVTMATSDENKMDTSESEQPETSTTLKRFTEMSEKDRKQWLHGWFSARVRGATRETYVDLLAVPPSLVPSLSITVFARAVDLSLIHI